jgi:small subunit ribosomal protein S9
MAILSRAVGRRKEAIAQVLIVRGIGQYLINNQPVEKYLQNNACSIILVKEPLEILKTIDSDFASSENKLSSSIFKSFSFDIFVKVLGGGNVGQAGAIKLGLSRAICKIKSIPLNNLLVFEDNDSNDLQNKNTIKEQKTNLTLISELRKQFKIKGHLRQDSRVKERRKYGLKKARKASQYHKR